MNKTDRKTEKYIKELYDEIKVPEFNSLFRDFTIKPKVLPQKHSFFGNRRLRTILSSCLCIALIMSSLIAFLPKWYNVEAPGVGNEEGPVIEPETNYYVNELVKEKIELAEAEKICNEKNYIFPVIENKFEVLAYKIVLESNKSLLLGVYFSYMYTNYDSMMYNCSIRFLDNNVKDALTALPNLSETIEYKNLYVHYSIPDHDGTWNLYDAWFELETSNCLIFYKSIQQDFQQGIMTIF